MTALRPKAYSYIRFSTPEQSKGDSLRRQTVLAEAYVKQHGLDLQDLSYQDLGISAFRGSNLETGALGQFLEAVKAEVVPQGSYLLVEAIDRISRDKARRAMRVIEDLCDAGIVVVTLTDGKAYDKATLDDDPMALMYLLITAMRGNEESRMKQVRLRASWTNKRAKASTEVLTARAPTWLRLVGEGKARSFEVIEDKAAVVRRVFDMTLAGHGQHKIAQTFNAEGVPTFDRGKMWHRSFVVKLLQSEAVIGTLVPHVIEVDDKRRKTRKPQAKVTAYFPPVVEAQVFHDVQAGMRTKAPRGRHSAGKPETKNVLAGMACCPECGGTMSRVKKTEKDVYLICSKAKASAGCKYVSVRYEWTELALFHHVDWIEAEKTGGTDNLDALIAATRVRDEAAAEVERMVRTVADNPGSVAVKAMLAHTEAELLKAEDDLREAEAKADQTSGPMVETRIKRLGEALSREDVAGVNAALRTLVEKVVVDYRSGELVFHWRHGPETRTLYMMPKGSR